MADDATGRAGPAARGTPLRTKPFGLDPDRMQQALQRELRRSVAPSLVVILGHDVGARAVLHDSVEIGRDPGCELPLHDDNVSWRHARVEDRGGEWVVVDLGSTNGTLVNGAANTGGTLRVGDRVFLGRTVLEVQQDPLRDAQAAEIERLLSIDELSGLWVKRRFDAELRSSVAVVLGAEVATLSLVVMDMDGVKAINDTHGHSMGAFTIGETGRLIGDHVQGRGFATRFGGDEFAAAFLGATKAEAVAIAETIRVAVGDHVYAREGVCVRPGLSCGVATLPEDATDADSLFQAADEAMYRAKRAGKNRVAT
jgi:diguanylate cyclase (GGDEF)-like protein